MEEKEMKLTDVEKSNILICEFMGGKYNGIYDVEINGVSDYIGVLKYHTSWDWLMPVVEKIESVGFEFGICQGEACVMNDLKDLAEPIRSSTLPERFETVTNGNKIDATYKAVIAFIQWYNSTPNK